MQTFIGHIQFNVDAANLAFYRSLMAFLGWQAVYDDQGMLGVMGPDKTSLWFAGYSNGTRNDYDGLGMNHLGIGAASQADVDATCAYLAEQGVPLLFETPRHRPEFSQDAASTYYQAMFETPDRILFEVVYIGPKGA
jgi:catechol 2,3-dioxygenase-like lactoylglutathione lyase family enzyme